MSGEWDAVLRYWHTESGEHDDEALHQALAGGPRTNVQTDSDSQSTAGLASNVQIDRRSANEVSTRSALDTEWAETVQRHEALLQRRGQPLSWEQMPPTTQSSGWYWDAVQHVPESGRVVARQIARLCGDDSEVTLPWRTLVDAVGQADRAGRTTAYVQRGVRALIELGWLEKQVVGKGRGARTTWRLLPGELTPWEAWLDSIALPTYEGLLPHAA